MATEIRMPQFGVSMETGTIEQWHKKVGDKVAVGDVLASIETEKLTNDIISEINGVVLAIVAQEGEDVPVQGLVTVIGEPGEVWPVGGAPAETKTLISEVTTETEEAVAVHCTDSMNRIKASPLARKVAAELQVNLEKVSPTGTSGRIKAKDVYDYNEKSKVLAANQGVESIRATVNESEPSTTTTTVPAGQITRGIHTERMSSMRKAISTNMMESKNTNAQTNHRMVVDMTAAIALRNQYKALGIKVSYNDIIVRACAKALQDMPIVNASVDGNNIVYHDYVNVGTAVSVPGGLIVPVIKDADIIGLSGIAAKSMELIEKARDGKLTDADYHGGTFTVSSLGMFDLDDFVAIINPPESAILAVGKIAKTPVVITNGEGEDEIVIKSMCNLCLSYDHRIIDGAEAAKFLQSIKKYLQNPLLLL